MVEPEGPFEVQVPGSFELFYQQQYAGVVGLMYGLSGSRWVAEDLAQDAFLRTHRDWARVREMDSPEGWVRRVAINLAKSRLRRLRAETRARLRLDGWTAISPPVSDPESDLFWEEVRRLPTRQAQTVALHYIEDLSVAEIAGVLGISEGAVKAHLHRGRERLRRQLSAKGVINGEV